ncbi:MAG: hypothetical protein V3V16_10545 [Melioribacteraceae bacterium]
MLDHIKNIIWILVFYLSLLGFLFAQEKNELNLQTTLNDSIKIEAEQKYKLKLAPHLKTKSPLLSLGKSFDPFVETFEFIVPPHLKEDKNQPLSYSERQRIKSEINQAMKVYRNGKRKTDLGVFGKVLFYSQAAAVLGLAVYHVHKYGFK